MKKSLILVVALLCMASLMAAMAYTTATVNNGASFKVSNTTDALLALEAGDHTAAGYTTGSTSNELVINWANGNDHEYGVQSGSVYFWDDLFTVKNNADHNVRVKISVPKDSAMPEANIGSKVSLRAGDNGSWVTVASRHTGAYGNEVVFDLAAGKTIDIDSQIDSLQRTLANGEKSFNIVVVGERIE